MLASLGTPITMNTKIVFDSDDPEQPLTLQQRRELINRVPHHYHSPRSWDITHGYHVERLTVAELSRIHRISPARIYQIIEKYERRMLWFITVGQQVEASGLVPIEQVSYVRECCLILTRSRYTER